MTANILQCQLVGGGKLGRQAMALTRRGIIQKRTLREEEIGEPGSDYLRGCYSEIPHKPERGHPGGVCARAV